MFPASVLVRNLGDVRTLDASDEKCRKSERGSIVGLYRLSINDF